jgi:hypothetical protein
MSFCATSRRLGAETLYPNLTIGGAARETGMLIEKDPLGCQAEKRGPAPGVRHPHLYLLNRLCVQVRADVVTRCRGERQRRRHDQAPSKLLATPEHELEPVLVFP